jgi:hypothetical protein
MIAAKTVDAEILKLRDMDSDARTASGGRNAPPLTHGS